MKECEALEQRIEQTACAKNNPNQSSKQMVGSRSFVCEGKKLAAGSRVTTHTGAGGKTSCATESEVIAETGNPACGNLVNDKNPENEKTCVNGTRTVPWKFASAAEIAKAKERLHVACFEPAKAKTGYILRTTLLAQASGATGGTSVTVCADDNDKLEAATRADAQRESGSGGGAPTAAGGSSGGGGAQPASQGAQQGQPASVGAQQGSGGAPVNARAGEPTGSEMAKAISERVKANTDLRGAGADMKQGAVTTADAGSVTQGNQRTITDAPQQPAGPQSDLPQRQTPQQTPSSGNGQQGGGGSAPVRAEQGKDVASMRPVAAEEKGSARGALQTQRTTDTQGSARGSSQGVSFASGQGAESSRPSLFSSPGTFFSQLFGGALSEKIVSQSGSGATQPYVTPQQQGNSVPKNISQQFKAPQVDDGKLPRVTTEDSLDTIAKLAFDGTKSTSKDSGAVPAGALKDADTQAQLLEKLLKAPTPEELVKKENQKNVAIQKSIDDVMKDISLEKSLKKDSTEPLQVSRDDQKQKVEVAFAPETVSKLAQQERQVVSDMGPSLQSRIKTDTALLEQPTVQEVVRAVRALIEPLEAQYAAGKTLKEDARGEVVKTLRTRATWVGTAAYGKSYDGSVVIASVAKQLEVVAGKIEAKESTQRIHAGLTALLTTVAQIPHDSEAVIRSVADLPQDAHEWGVAHCVFYEGYIMKLLAQTTNDDARAKYQEALRLVRVSEDAMSTGHTTDTAIAGVVKSRSLVLAAGAIEKEAVKVRQNVTKEAVTAGNAQDESLTVWGSVLKVFGW